MRGSIIIGNRCNGWWYSLIKIEIFCIYAHSQGNRDSNRISLKSRGIHPSFITNYDILVCGNSDWLQVTLYSDVHVLNFLNCGNEDYKYILNSDSDIWMAMGNSKGIVKIVFNRLNPQRIIFVKKMNVQRLSKA